jgi:hypothetical protein
MIRLPALFGSPRLHVTSLADSVSVPDLCRLFDNVNLAVHYPSGMSRIPVRRLTAILPPILSKDRSSLLLYEIFPIIPRFYTRNRHFVTHDRLILFFHAPPGTASRSSFVYCYTTALY